MKTVINSDASLQRAIGDLREAYREDRYVTVTYVAGSHRSNDQNAISHAWYQQVANELREDAAHEVKRYCKLHFGVPILRAEDEEFRDAYDRTIRSWLSYEQKLQAMDIMPVTSRMTKKQLSAYLGEVQKHYWDRVKLEFPASERAAA